jgi:hypothetical protein
MTFEQWWDSLTNGAGDWLPISREKYRACWQAAVAAERERCTKIAEQDKWNSGAVVRQQIAAEIREQGDGK